MLRTRYLNCPIGVLELSFQNSIIQTISHNHKATFPDIDIQDQRENALINELQLYFEGKLTEFSTKQILQEWVKEKHGTDFQRMVWQKLCEIPYGQTISYKQLAEQLGQPKAYRAVANACGQNPIPIIIPCHRVIGSDGTLTGLGGAQKPRNICYSLKVLISLNEKTDFNDFNEIQSVFKKQNFS